MTIKRKSRIKRSRKAISLELTSRDVKIIEALAYYRFLTVEHLAIITNTSSRTSLNRRLRQLFDAAYVDRPNAQFQAMAYSDKRPMVYALGNQGAEFISNSFQLPLFDGDWTEKNRRVKEKFVAHTLGIADFMIAIEHDLEQHERYRIVRRDELLAGAPQATAHAKNPFAWLTRFTWNQERHNMSIVPDAIFAIEDTSRPAGSNRMNFFVEIDKGTMPVDRRDIKQTSFLRKMYSYADTFERKLHTERFGMSNFRVLTIAKSHQRIMTIQKVYQREITTLAPASLFIFGTIEQLADYGGLHLPYVKANGEQVSLV